LTGEIQTWAARRGWPGRRGVASGRAMRSRSGARCGRAPAGSLPSTSQPTRSSSSSRRSELVSRNAASARCASANVRNEGNMCSHRKDGRGWTAPQGSACTSSWPQNGLLEPSNWWLDAMRISSEPPVKARGREAWRRPMPGSSRRQAAAVDDIGHRAPYAIRATIRRRLYCRLRCRFGHGGREL